MKTFEDFLLEAKAATEANPLWLEECGCCGEYHRPDFNGDCRNDLERFPVPHLPYDEFNIDEHVAENSDGDYSRIEGTLRKKT